MTNETATSPTPSAAPDWRPQGFGRRSAKQISDPVIEPLWSGLRVLASVAEGVAELHDADGEPQHRAAIQASLGGAVQARSAVIDGYLTIDAAQSGIGITAGPPIAAPSPGDVARQMLLGAGGRNRRAELVEAAAARNVPDSAPSEGVVFVAVDLLLLDGESLLDVPLLERKRLLDAVLVPDELSRLGIHVRPPIGPWLGTWRNLGFRQLAYKEANSRYRPGEPNEDWATADIPSR